MHDIFPVALECDTISATRSCHATSAKTQRVDWVVFCMTRNEGEREWCTVISHPPPLGAAGLSTRVETGTGADDLDLGDVAM